MHREIYLVLSGISPLRDLPPNWTEGHLTLADVGTMATCANVKTVVLTHLTSRAGTDDYPLWVAEVSKHFSGQVIAAKDLMEF